MGKVGRLKGAYFCGNCGHYHLKGLMYEEHFEHRTTPKNVFVNLCKIYYCKSCEIFHFKWKDMRLFYSHSKYALYFYFCPKCNQVHHYGEIFILHLGERTKEIKSYKKTCRTAVKEIKESIKWETKKHGSEYSKIIWY